MAMREIVLNTQRVQATDAGSVEMGRGTVVLRPLGD
jgi:hypothetical protein